MAHTLTPCCPPPPWPAPIARSIRGSVFKSRQGRMFAIGVVDIRIIQRPGVCSVVYGTMHYK